MAGNKNSGRKETRLTAEQVGEIETLAAFLTAEQIADYLGVGRTTFFEIMKRQDDISERYKRGKAKAIGTVARSLISQAREGNTSAMIFFLKTQAGWKETNAVEMTGKDGTELVVRWER
jgi:IS30 family transposase